MKVIQKNWKYGRKRNSALSKKFLNNKIREKTNKRLYILYKHVKIFRNSQLQGGDVFNFNHKFIRLNISQVNCLVLDCEGIWRCAREKFLRTFPNQHALKNWIQWNKISFFFIHMISSFPITIATKELRTL